MHIEGSVCIPSFSPGFGSKLAWIADHDREVVFIGRDDADGRRAAQLALSVGVRNVAGLLAGGMTNWRQEGNAVARTERLAADELPARMAREPELQLLDVRERDEWDAGHVQGSVWMPWHDIDSVPRGLDPDRPIAVACAAGKRSATAASLLKLHGAREVIHVTDGGIPRLAEHGIELVAAMFAPPRSSRRRQLPGDAGDAVDVLARDEEELARSSRRRGCRGRGGTPRWRRTPRRPASRATRSAGRSARASRSPSIFSTRGVRAR